MTVWTRLLNRIMVEQHKLMLLAILLIALLLRLWSISFDLPNLYHPDEDALIMPAINIIKSGDLEPTRLEYGSFHIYILAVVAALVFLISARSGHIGSTDQLIIYERGTYPAIYAHPEYFLASRMVSVLMGVGIVLLVFMLARRLGNQQQGLFAAAFAAVLPVLVIHSHFATPDTPLTFMSLLGLYLLLRVYDNWEIDNMWSFVGAGFICGLAVSTKYNGIILVIPLLLVPLLKVRSLDELLTARVLAGPVSMAVGFLAGTPYAILNIPKFLFWFGYSLRLYNYVPPGAELPGTSWQWHAHYLLTSSNLIIVVLGLIGFFLSLQYWGKRGWIINSFAILMWWAIIEQANRQTRMWLPTAPIFAIWAALTLTLFLSWLSRQLPAHWSGRQMALSMAPFLFLGPLLFSAVQVNLYLQWEDVRSRTASWVEENMPSGTHIAVDYFSPNLNPDLWPVTRLSRLYEQDVDWFQEQGVEYLILNGVINNPDDLSERDLIRYNSLVKNICPVETLSGTFLANNNIEMFVYKLPPCETR